MYNLESMIKIIQACEYHINVMHACHVAVGLEHAMFDNYIKQEASVLQQHCQVHFRISRNAANEMVIES